MLNCWSAQKSLSDSDRDATTLGSLALSDSVLKLPNVVPSPVVPFINSVATFLRFNVSVLFCVRGASASCSSTAGSSWPTGSSSTSVLGNTTVLFNSADSDQISYQLAVMSVIFLLLFVQFAVSNFPTSSIYEA